MKKTKVRFLHAACTDVGKIRQANEDSFVVDEWLGIYILADGMGGHAAGDVASQSACEAILDFLGRPPDPPAFGLENLKRAMEEANRRVYEQAQNDDSLAGMGTTLILLWVQDDKALIGHVGDSRLYSLTVNGIEQLTEDHEEPITGWLTSAVGIQRQIPKVEFQERRIRPGEYYLLASDGLFSDRKNRRLDENEIREIILKHELDVESACRELVSAALERSGDDNITAILLHAANGE